MSCLSMMVYCSNCSYNIVLYDSTKTWIVDSKSVKRNKNWQELKFHINTTQKIHILANTSNWLSLNNFRVSDCQENEFRGFFINGSDSCMSLNPNAHQKAEYCVSNIKHTCNDINQFRFSNYTVKEQIIVKCPPSLNCHRCIYQNECLECNYGYLGYTCGQQVNFTIDYKSITISRLINTTVTFKIVHGKNLKRSAYGNKKFTFDNLQPGLTYNISMFATTYDNGPYISLRTKCDKINRQNFTYNTTSDGKMQVFYSYDNNKSCPNNFRVLYGNQTKVTQNFDKLIFDLNFSVNQLIILENDNEYIVHLNYVKKSMETEQTVIKKMPKTTKTTESSGLIVSIVLSIVFSVAIIILIIWYLKCRKKLHNANDEQVEMNLYNIALLQSDNENIHQFDKEFEEIPSINKLMPRQIGILQHNKCKNRYNNIIPYDSTRVSLSTGEDENDYINANYITGYKGEKSYIATQCPKAITINDFWMMIWQQNVSIIVCLAKFSEGKNKMAQYWSEPIAGYFRYIKVELVRTEWRIGYCLRIFKLTENETTKTVQQFQYTSWPDHEIPLQPISLMHFIRKVQKADKTKWPIVVHCSAGIGRTGTFIMCDNMMRLGGDVKQYLKIIRDYRQSMVANVMQYRLVYFIMSESMEGRQTAISKEDFTMNSVSIQRIEDDLAYTADRMYINELVATPINDTIPVTNFKGDLEKLTINAKYVHGIEYKNQYICTRQPNKKDFTIFWSLVLMRKTKLIISLNRNEVNNSFWPKKNGLLDNMPHTSIKVKFGAVQNYSAFNVYELRILLGGKILQDKAHKVTLIDFHSWENVFIMPEIENFYNLYKYYRTFDVDQCILCCSDGENGCGIFMASDMILKKLEQESMVDVCWAVRSVGKFKKNLIKNKDQFMFLYNIALYMLKMDKEIYENISQQSTTYENIFTKSIDF
ncbi:PREDICTED: receptor-type tyrosine-protein phosphatase epsilon-like [Nicrophorus vespilloides]|uniref:protein-tyrosine-phosphatase n=1 Tax=Nicrophorus vespilloides TaxID=110193 RepID=A0ABM1NB78_NICVS|nr:PREDICTED: receptor-type tyrosine-protein phosphatase epsilon-like [Nicrophorus vespilloides]